MKKDTLSVFSWREMGVEPVPCVNMKNAGAVATRSLEAGRFSCRGDFRCKFPGRAKTSSVNELMSVVGFYLQRSFSSEPIACRTALVS